MVGLRQLHSKTPVKLVFVMSDISIKSRGTIRGHPPPNRWAATATATSVLRQDQHRLSPATLPQTPSVTLPHPPTFTYTPEGLIVPRATLLTPEWKKKSSGDKSKGGKTKFIQIQFIQVFLLSPPQKKKVAIGISIESPSEQVLCFLFMYHTWQVWMIMESCRTSTAWQNDNLRFLRTRLLGHDKKMQHTLIHMQSFNVSLYTAAFWQRYQSALTFFTFSLTILL